MKQRILTYKPPRIAMLLAATAAAVSWLGHPVDIRLAAPTYVAVAIIAAGFAVMTIGWWQFRQRGVLICPTAPTHYLIQHGIYRWSRNPMYLGIFLMLGGLAALAGDLSFYAAAVGFLLIMDRYFCPYEEAKLEASFPGEYAAYRARVRRWI